MTYNQSVYIIDALNGFTMQQTSFPFVAVVVDDASTDGEQDVIKSYVKKHFDYSEANGYLEWETEDAFWTFARHKENEKCHFVVVLLKRNLYREHDKKEEVIKDWMQSQYIAICEGDDYWIDPLKLQKQVDFLEGHEEYSMCFHAADVKYECGGESPYRNGTHFSDLEDREYTSTEVVSKWMVPTASIVYRRAVVENYQIKHSEWLVYGDITLTLKCSHTGKIFGMSEVMSVYRIQPNSLTNNPEYVNSTVFKLPNHYRCLRMSFPKVEKGPLEWCISYYSYVCMKKQNNPFMKLRDFFMFVWWDPKQALNRIGKILTGCRKNEC